jgi:DNA repair exonuclease SbcCD ATPase subunit
MPLPFPAFRNLIALTVLGASACLPLSAQPDLPTPPPLPPGGLPPPPQGLPPNLPDTSELLAQLQQLEELLELSDDQLDRLERTIGYIRSMSPDTRDAMRIRIRQVTQSNPRLQEEIRHFQSILPDLPHNDISQFWLALDSTARQDIRDTLDNLSPQQSAAALQPHIRDFVQRRDQALEAMRQQLPSAPSKPQE